MLMTREEITNYLNTSGIADNYVCGDGTFCDMFSRRVLPSNVFTQLSFGDNLPGRNWWIEYISEQNKFVLRCSYFDATGSPITREQFIEALKPKFSDEKINSLPAVLYTPEKVIEWVPTAEGEWTATYSVSTPTSGCMIAGALSKILHKSVPVPPAPAQGECYCVTQCSSCGDSNTIYWTDINGVVRSDVILAGEVRYICSTSVPYESSQGNAVILSCGGTCTSESTNFNSSPCVC